MFKVVVTNGFITKTEEQAEYIRKFFEDAASLMTCETSSTESSEVKEIEEPISCQNPECPRAGRCGGECARNF